MPVRRRKNVVAAKPAPKKKSDFNPKVKGLSISGYTMPTSIADDSAKYGALFLGLDPSLTGFGISGVCENGAIIRYDTLKGGGGKNGLKGMQRVEYLMKELQNILLVASGCSLYDKIFVAREDYARKMNDTSDTPLKELGGVLEWTLHQMGYPLYALNIQTVKKFAGGKGGLDKDEMADAVHKRLGFQGEENEVDAFAVATTAMALANRRRIKGLDAKMIETLDAQEENALTNLR